MQRELADLLTAYLMGWKNVRDCAEWLSGIDWDTNPDRRTRQLVGGIELLTTEVLEGLRPEAEFWQEAAKFVASETGLIYGQPLSMMELQRADSSNNRNSPTVEITVGAGAVVAESQSWSISPLLVSE
ncbi:MAG: hypothetical protein R6U93_03415 [Dehalococcoidia bacterium]